MSLMDYYRDRPMTRYLLEKRAALPSPQQTQAVTNKGAEERKKGFGTAAKVVGGTALLGLGLATGKVQQAGKMLKRVSKNPATGKFDPKHMVQKGWKDMGSGTGSYKRMETQADLMRQGVGKGHVFDYKGMDPTNKWRHSGWASKGKQYQGQLGDSARGRVQTEMQRAHPEMFNKGQFIDNIDDMDPNKFESAYKTYQDLMGKERQFLQRGSEGKHLLSNIGMHVPGEKAVMTGLTGMGVAGELGTSQDADGRQRSIGERLIRAGGVGLAGVALNPLVTGGAISPGMLAFEAGNRAVGAGAGMIGRGATAATGGEFGSPVTEVRSHIPFAGGH